MKNKKYYQLVFSELTGRDAYSQQVKKEFESLGLNSVLEDLKNSGIDAKTKKYWETIVDAIFNQVEIKKSDRQI